MTTNNSVNDGKLYSAGDGKILIARASGQAIPANISAGANVTVTNGTNSITIAATGGTGTTLQVVQTTKTDTFTTSNTTPTDITGMSVTITPSSSSNKVLIIANINFVTDNTGFCLLLRGASVIYEGDAGSGQTQCSVACRAPGSDTASIFSENIMYLDSPATTSATTYKLQGWTSAGTFGFNRSLTDAGSAAFARTASSIIAIEVKG